MSERSDSVILDSEILKKFEPAIRQFFEEQFAGGPDTPRSYGLDFDISQPGADDMRLIRLSDFVIKDFKTSPTSTPGKLSFHFYVGGTEFHIQGKAADRIYELTDEE